MQNNILNIVDFFSGVGGMSKGLSKAGFKVVAGLDNNKDVGKSFKLNNIGAEFYNLDITDTKSNLKILSEIKNKHTESDFIFAACAPCQPFSAQNKKYEDDKRKSLLLNFFLIIEKMNVKDRPTAIIAENVGPMKKRGNEILEDIQKKLRNMNYEVLPPTVHNAADYNVPQLRKRLIFIAIKKDRVKKSKFSWEYFRNNYSVNKRITVREAFTQYKLNRIEAGQSDLEDPLHRAKRLSDLNLKRIKFLKSGESRDKWPKDLWLNCHQGKYQGHKDVYGRLDWNKPSPTLTTKCTSLSNGRFGHPEENRAISLREAAILQTMGDFEFEPPYTHDKIAKMIGNAVPPELARRLGLFIKEILI